MMERENTRPGRNGAGTSGRKRHVTHQRDAVAQVEFECLRHRNHMIMMACDSRELLEVAVMLLERGIPLRMIASQVIDLPDLPDDDEIPF